MQAKRFVFVWRRFPSAPLACILPPKTWSFSFLRQFLHCQQSPRQSAATANGENSRRRCRCLAIGALMAAGSGACASELRCHLDYGGEVRVLSAAPVDSPYTVPTRAIGSYFLFRMILQTQPSDLASIKLYVYADRDEGPLPLQQATYPYPPPASGMSAHGFTGLQHVYEPVRDGELKYWCEWMADPITPPAMP